MFALEFTPTVFGFQANKTIDLRQTNAPLIQNAVIQDVESDFINHGVYLVGNGAFGYYNFILNTSIDLGGTNKGGFSIGDDKIFINSSVINSVTYDSTNDGAYITGERGLFGYYNKSSNITIDLRETDFGDWIGGQIIFSTAYDSIHDGAFIVAQSGVYGYYDKPNNITIDLRDIDSGDFIANAILTSVSFDSNNDGFFIVGRHQGTGLFVFAYYNHSANSIIDLSNTDPDNFLDTVTGGLGDVSYDSINDGAYIVGNSGKFAYYSRATNMITDLSSTDTGNWIGAASIEGVSYDSINDGAYIVGQSGLIGYYSKLLNITADLRSTDGADWLGSANDILGVAYNNKSRGIYFSGNGLFGVYSLINIAATKTGVSVSVDFDNKIAIVFTNVTSAGETIMNVSKTPPTNATGFLLNGTYYDIQTTANYSGSIIIILPYDPSMPNSQAVKLKIYHYDKTLNSWVDVTTLVDRINKLVIGNVISLSPFAIGIPLQEFVGFLPPIKNDSSSKFRLGKTIPVKFQLIDTNGSFVTNATAKIYVVKINEDGTIGNEEEGIPNNKKKAGNDFRYDSTSNQYIFNLNTKSLSEGTWQIRVSLDDGTSHTVLVSLFDNDKDSKNEKKDQEDDE